MAMMLTEHQRLELGKIVVKSLQVAHRLLGLMGWHFVAKEVLKSLDRVEAIVERELKKEQEQ